MINSDSALNASTFGFKLNYDCKIISALNTNFFPQNYSHVEKPPYDRLFVQKLSTANDEQTINDNCKYKKQK